MEKGLCKVLMYGLKIMSSGSDIFRKELIYSMLLMGGLFRTGSFVIPTFIMTVPMKLQKREVICFIMK